MNKQTTLSIIKPDSVLANKDGEINALIQSHSFRIIGQKRMMLCNNTASTFYAIHKDRPFFNDLVKYMCSGPVVVQVLEKENAVDDYRNLMGATNPKDACEGTIRKLFGKSIEENSVHGSDSKENAEIEIAFFFAGRELH